MSQEQKARLDFSAGKEIYRQILWLENAICKELENLRLAASELEFLEEELREFLDYYYHEVGALFARLHRLDAQLTNTTAPQQPQHHTRQKAVHSGLTISRKTKGLRMPVGSRHAVRKHIRDQEIKRLYRKLAKAFHPDTTPLEERAKHYFYTLTDAYRRGSLNMLLRLEQRYAEMHQEPTRSPVEKLERLERRHDNILREKDRLLQKKHQLTQQSTYRLMQRAFLSQEQGWDLIAMIKSRVEGEIEEKEKRLYKDKREDSSPSSQAADAAA